MPKSIEDVFTALEGLEDGAELAGAVKADLQKKNNEAKNLRTRLRETEGKQTGLSEKVTKAADALGIDFDAEDFDAVLDGHKKSLADLKTAAEKAKKQAKKDDDPEGEKAAAELIRLTTELEKASKLAEKETKRANENETKFNTERTKRLDVLKNTAIMAALADSKAVKPSQLAKILLPSVKVNDDETLAFVDDKGDEVALADGIKGWLGSNPEFVMDNQKPGSGSSTSSKGGKGVLQVTRAQLRDPKFYREHQKEILAEQYSLVD